MRAGQRNINSWQDYPDLKVDVLVLGHHGSKHSSAYDFLAHLKPKLAVASAGFDNRYGHPSALVQQRLAALDIPLMHGTARKFALLFRSATSHAYTTVSSTDSVAAALVSA